MFKNPFTADGGASHADQPALPPQRVDNNNNNGNSGNNNNGMRDDSLITPNKDGIQDDPNKPKGGNSDGINLDKIWDPKVGADGKPLEVKGPKRYLPEVTDQQLDTHLGKLDFTSNIKPEHFAAIVQGGEGAAVALKEIINHVGRAAVKSNYKSSATMFEKGIGSARDDFSSSVPETVKSELSLNNLAKDNPLMKNPRYATMVRAIRAQIQEANPGANPDDIQTATRQYFDDMVTDMKGGKENSEDGSKGIKTKDGKIVFNDGQADWDQWAIPTLE